MTLDPSVEIASRLLGTLVFATAVIGKLRHRDEFIGVVANYRLLPDALTGPAAWAIVLLELFVVAALLLGVWIVPGAITAIALLLLFAIAMSINIARGRTHIDCGCFQSALTHPLSGVLIVRNLLLTIALVPTLIAALAYPMPLLTRLLSAPSVATAIDGVAAGVALFVLYQASGLLIALRDLAAAMHKRFV